MNKAIFCYQNVPGGEKNISILLKNEFKKRSPVPIKFIGKVEHHLHLPFSFVLTSITSFAFWKKTFDTLTADKMILTHYIQYAALKASSSSPTPFVYYYHGDKTFNREALKSTHRTNIFTYGFSLMLKKIIDHVTNKMLSEASSIIVLSENSRSQLLKKYPLINKHLVKVTCNSVDSNIFKPPGRGLRESLRKSQNLNYDDFVVTYVGQIEEAKGVEIFCQALEKIKSNNCKGRVVFPEPNIKQQKFLDYLQKTFDQSSIDFIKGDYKSIYNIYITSDVVVLPSKTEQFPLVMLESISCGTLFLGSKTGAMPEVLRHIDSRLILQNLSTREIVKKINWIKSLSSTQFKLLQQNALKESRKYTTKAMFESFYQNALHDVTNQD